jgi:hypothetical protein
MAERIKERLLNRVDVRVKANVFDEFANQMGFDRRDLTRPEREVTPDMNDHIEDAHMESLN